jgi:hypothetical protein
MSLEKSNDLIGNGTRDLPACSIVLQPTTLPRAPNAIHVLLCISEGPKKFYSKLSYL